MKNTTNRGYRYPEDNDTPDIPRDFEHLASDLDKDVPQAGATPPPSPKIGAIWYNTTNQTLNTWDGTKWESSWDWGPRGRVAYNKTGLINGIQTNGIAIATCSTPDTTGRRLLVQCSTNLTKAAPDTATGAWIYVDLNNGVEPGSQRGAFCMAPGVVNMSVMFERDGLGPSTWKLMAYTQAGFVNSDPGVISITDIGPA